MNNIEKIECKGKTIIRNICFTAILIVLSFSSLLSQEILQAVSHGNLEKVRQLIEADSSLINSKNEWGHTPLHNANSIEMAQFLIDNGANVNSLAYNGLAPLHFTYDYDIAKLLIESGADIDIYDKYDGTIGDASYAGTVLQTKIGYGQEKIAELLIQRGAKLDKRDANGNTELMIAAQTGRFDVAKCLLENGADINAVNNNNHTSLYFAAKHGYKNMVELLIANGANTNDIREENYGKSTQLDIILSEGEAYLWHNHGWGYTVKTKEHLLSFNYFGMSDTASLSGLGWGTLNPYELQGQNFTMFHIYCENGYLPNNERAYTISKHLPDTKFIFNFLPKKVENQNLPAHKIVRAHESITQDGMTIHTIPAVAGGVGYLIEVDGIKMFFGGLHIGSLDSLENKKYKAEIDYLEQFGPIDIAITTTHSHFGQSNNYDSYLYMIDKLSPKEIHLMAASNYQQYLRCSAVLKKRNVTLKYPESDYTFGERYHYTKLPTSD